MCVKNTKKDFFFVKKKTNDKNNVKKLKYFKIW